MGANEKENKSKNEGHYFEIASQQKNYPTKNVVPPSKPEKTNKKK